MLKPVEEYVMCGREWLDTATTLHFVDFKRSVSSIVMIK